MILYDAPCSAACAAIFASARSKVEAVALMLWAKAPKDIMERAVTTTKVLMDFMVIFLKSFCSVWGFVALM